MDFFSARCETCVKTLVKDEEVALAYRICGVTSKNHELARVQLNSQQPWCGIRVICHDCLKFFQQQA